MVGGHADHRLPGRVFPPCSPAPVYPMLQETIMNHEESFIQRLARRTLATVKSRPIVALVFVVAGYFIGQLGLV